MSTSRQMWDPVRARKAFGGTDVEYRLSLVPHVKDVQVNLVFDPPWSRDMMSEEAQLEAGVFF